MKMKDLQMKSASELEKLLDEKRTRLRDLRFQVVRGEVKNVREIAQIKRDIARILTLTNPSYGK